ncbi:MAG: methylmalonyl Co-A mutase-associated GTPase MeaB [Candidatus Lernaella stagnicola]|nr:methylmalonyl Co-A mutase-associated GTPase MeaB [Candidatus Lernaella stagnicola]
MQLLERMMTGDPRALPRLITLIENHHPDMPAVMDEVYSRAGGAQIIGVTGPPGAGKSTLVDKLTVAYRQAGKTVGIVAIDPSSPFSGGALLGDRVRMMQHAADEDVFIRSLGSRGSHGGLSLATREVVHLLDAAGYDIVLVETVGVGQTELDIMELAHTVVVVLVPESGDTVQTMKAGLTEIADLFVVNKADRDGADRMARELSLMVELNNRAKKWDIPVLMTTAVRSEGVEAVVEMIDKHHDYTLQSGDLDRRRETSRLAEFVEVIVGEISGRLREDQVDSDLAGLVRRVKLGEVNPYKGALQVLGDPVMLEGLFASDAKE